MTVVYLVVVIVSAFKLLTLNYRQSTNAKDLETKILETQLKLKEQELNYLKMQIHPHFLFNTLNTLYGLAIKKAEQTPDMILKLSNLLDYLLYQADKPSVSISEEVEHIKDYLTLERLRFHDSLLVDLDIDIKQNLSIAPMLLLPFVENSFKHGSLIQGKLHISIQLISNEDELEFNIINSSTEAQRSVHGIGLKNIRKRLELLYPDMYQLNLVQTPHQYEVQLKINKLSIESR